MKNSMSFLFAKNGLWVVRNILNFFLKFYLQYFWREKQLFSLVLFIIVTVSCCGQMWV